MPEPTTSEPIIIPAGIAALPVDDRVGAPVPWSSATHPNGRPDFTRVDRDKARQASDQRRCGVCGFDLGYWVAFLGTTSTAATGVFHDPPMHEECATASLTMCPHIAHQRPVTRSERSGRTTPDGWIVWVTRTWRFAIVRGRATFLPAPAKRLHRYAYNDRGELTTSD